MASNTAFILQIVGTVIGGYYGGQWGAYFGGLIGGAVGNLIDPQLAEGPRLGDLIVRASTYGRTIPLIYGRENRIGGNIIWSNGILEHAHTTGHTWSGDKQTTYSYTASFAIALGQGTMRNLEAIYANGKLLWTRAGTIAAQAAATTKVQQTVDWCLTLPNASDAALLPVCITANEQIDFLTGYDATKLLPDFEPWIAVQYEQVTLASDGGGEYQGRNAATLSGTEFNQLEWFPGTPDQPTSLIITGQCAKCGPTPAYRNTAYLVIRGLKLARFGNQIPTIEVVTAGLAEETVADVLADMCARASVDIDEIVPRGALSQFPVRGYAIANAKTVIAAIRPLMAVYPFDACDHAGVLRFTPRQRGPVATITQDEMGARPVTEGRAPVFPIERLPDLEMPSEASVSYVDPENGYQPGTQIAQRASGNAQTKLIESVPLTMTGAEARALAERLLWEGWLSRERVSSARLSRKYDFLQPGDAFAVPTPGGGYTLYRIVNLERGDNGVIDLVLMREDSLAYAGNQPGGEVFVYAQTAPFYDDTTPYLFNAPVLASNEDNTGFHVALDSAGVDWPLADVYRSTDGGFTWTFAMRSNKRERIAYVLSSPDGAASADIWDRESVIVVEVLNAEAEAPVSVSEETLLLNATTNLLWIGDAAGTNGEVIQYATVVDNSDGTYELSNLLRGRRGTEHAIATHGTDDVAVFIPDTSTESLDYGQADWNLERQYAAASIGQEAEDVTFIDFAATGERLKPRSPVHVTGERDVSNNLTLEWIRRTRLFAPPMGYGDAPLGEASESYEVDILVGGNVVRTITATAPTAAYSAAEQTTDGITPGNPVTGNVYQISAAFGRGHAAPFTV